MAEQKKFNAFAGVFTPSLLTILGVIMYMRLGWVVGNSGLVGVFIIITVAHVISITTGLSISSIATDKKVGAGGVYYVLSRSLGLPIGGAIGVTLFVGTAMSIALYLIGFAESFNACLGFDTGINGLRMAGSLALLVLTILAIISTSLALKAQFFILAAIIISIISILLGTSPAEPQSLPVFGSEGSVSMEVVFAIFFPAVTGFTAGIAMSGDLKDPKKSIPSGTLWSIAVGFVVYMGLAAFLFFSVDSEILKTDNNILLKMAIFAPAVFAGIWGATLSSALGGILGGPRILQAMSVDKITPKLFSEGVGKSNEPRNALLLTVLIAEGGILIGELDTIARVCSMFYLAAYGFINISFFLESWASSDFNPTFKVKRWIGLVGFIATFIVMFRLDMIAMVAAFIVIGGIYLWLTRKELALGSGDVWQSVWSSVVKTGLRRMDEKQDHKRNWKPNVLLFSAGTTHRPYLLEFSKELVGNRGIVTNFDLYENQEAAVLFPKHKQSVTDPVLKKYGVFGRQIEVKNAFKGIESIATTFGFSGIEPNTILMGWAKNTKDPIWFAQMTQKLINLDYNVLYLDYDERFGYRKYNTIDLWWRGVGNNAELMLNIAKFLNSSDLWRNAEIRVIMVDSANSNKKIIEKKISNTLEDLRINASIKIIGNALEKKPIYELMKIYSAETDLIVTGIPEIEMKKVGNFVKETNDLVGTIGTTLLVKASSSFDDVEFVTDDIDEQNTPTSKAYDQSNLPKLQQMDVPIVSSEVVNIEDALSQATQELVENAISPIQEKYSSLYQLILFELDGSKSFEGALKDVHQHFSTLLQNINNKLQQIRNQELPTMGDLLFEENITYLDAIEEVIKNSPKILKFEFGGNSFRSKFNRTARLLKKQALFPAIRRIYLQFGNNLYEKLVKTEDELLAKIYSVCEVDDSGKNRGRLKADIEEVITELESLIKHQLEFFQNISKKFEFDLLSVNREFSNTLSQLITDKESKISLRKIRKEGNSLDNKSAFQDILSFPKEWSTNQHHLHTSLETNLELAQVNLTIIEGLEELTTKVNEKVNKRIEDHFPINFAQVQKLHENHEIGHVESIFKNFRVNEDMFENANNLLTSLTKETALIPDLIRDEAILMSKSLMENYQATQLEGVPSINLDLPKIVSFIVESILHVPMQSYLEQYINEVSSTYFNQVNRINLVKYSLADSQADQNKQLLEKVLPQFESDLQIFENAKLRFKERLRSTIYKLQMELDTRYLAEHADNWSRYISVSKRKKGLASFSSRIKSRISDFNQSLKTSYSATKYESDVSVFESKYNLKSNIELGLDFTNSIYPSKTTLQELPFYYKQLFLGKQLPVQNRYIGRHRELQLIDKSISENRKGAILVAGKSSSGKTHFAFHIANKKFRGTTVYIDSKAKKGGVKELNQSFSYASGIAGDFEQCLIRLAPNSTIVIDDIEVWWNRKIENDALSIILKMIAKYSNKHRFILNVNVHAMESLSKCKGIKDVITSTIILPPVSKESLHEIILERHNLGGLDLSIKNEVKLTEDKFINQLTSRIHAECDGNVGVALHLWLRQIASCNENIIRLDDQLNVNILRVNDDNWKILLYQFLINKNLTAQDIENLFNSDALKVLSTLRELKKANILEDLGDKNYTINHIVKPNIEKWLVDYNILN